MASKAVSRLEVDCRMLCGLGETVTGARAETGAIGAAMARLVFGLCFFCFFIATRSPLPPRYDANGATL